MKWKVCSVDAALHTSMTKYIFDNVISSCYNGHMTDVMFLVPGRRRQKRYKKKIKAESLRKFKLKEKKIKSMGIFAIKKSTSYAIWEKSENFTKESKGDIHFDDFRGTMLPLKKL